jgi:pimeloyl-ACP methyl ester carboxylesterase
MLQVGSVELCAQAFGERDDPAIRLIGGSSSSMDGWETDFCEQLAAGGRFVVRYDLRDTGQSVHSPVGEPDYSSAELVADAVGVLDAYGIGAACVMGISMGGAMAQLVALDHADRVSALVLRGPTLVVHGAEDRLFPLGLAEAMANAIPGATLLVELGVGHEFVRRSWDTVIPAVLRVSGG